MPLKSGQTLLHYRSARVRVVERGHGPHFWTARRRSTPRRYPNDGRRVAYVSDKGGTGQVCLRPFPGPGPEVPVSIEGDEGPMWSHDDSEILYRRRLSGGAQFLTASVQDLRVTARGDSFESFLSRGRPCVRTPMRTLTEDGSSSCRKAKP